MSHFVTLIFLEIPNLENVFLVQLDAINANLKISAHNVLKDSILQIISNFNIKFLVNSNVQEVMSN